MGRLLVTLATLLVLVLGAAFVAPAFMDWNAYRPDIEQAASALLGRKISIIGDIDIALLPEPHLHAKKVVAEGGPLEAAQMTAEAVDLTLSLQALLNGGVEASRLKLLNPFLILDLSKPLRRDATPAKGPLPLAAGVTSLEIEGGRISVYPDAGQPEALILTGVDGTLAAPQQHANAYRFTGRVSREGQRFDVKFGAAAHGSGVKLTGSVTELRSKAVLQADGVLNTADAPVFDGTLAAIAPQALVGVPFDIQAKGAVNLNRAGLALSDLVLTMDPGNRPQVLTGSASVAFTPGTSDVTLQAPSLDADALLSGGAGSALAPGAAAGWDTFRAAAEPLLWLYPDFGVHLALAIDQIQLRGEFIEGVKVEGTRAAQKWLFEDAQATFPGETAIRLTGALKKTAGKPELLARTALEGKNWGRLNRWIVPAATNARSAPASVFKAGGLLTLSDDITAFTDVKGDVDGTPFTASLRLDKAPARKLKVSLAGDSFDLTSLEMGQTGSDALSSQSVKAAWYAALAQLTPVLGDDPASFETADVDVSAGNIRTSFIEAKNVAVQLKFNQDLLTVTKLSAETADGLSLRGEGVVPIRSAGQGKFDGRLEALSPQAVLKLAALAGYDSRDLGGRRAEDLAPANLAISYDAGGQADSATAQLSGNIGAARLDGRVQLKGSLAEWRAGRFSGQLALSAADGNKLAALLSTRAGRWLKALPRLPALSRSAPAAHPNGSIAQPHSRLRRCKRRSMGYRNSRRPFSFPARRKPQARRPSKFCRPRCWRSLAGSGKPILRLRQISRSGRDTSMPQSSKRSRPRMLSAAISRSALRIV